VTAYLAILRYDAEGLRGRRLLWLWLVLLAAAALWITLVAATQDELASEALATYLAWVLLPLSLLVVAATAGSAINAEASVAADSILSRAATREAYLAAKITARIATLLGAYAAVTIPAALLIARYGVADTSTAGLVAGLAALTAFLWLAAAGGLALSVTLTRPAVATLALLAVLALLTATTEAIGLDRVSPLALLDDLAATLRGDADIARALEAAAVYAVAGVALLAAAFWRYRAREL
jgi:hypothetical protein